MKSSLLAVFFFGAVLAACSGTGTPTSGGGGEGGEDPVTSSSGNTSSSSSGTGGAGGNGTGGMGMGGSGGGMAATPKADKLGQVCNQMTPCPTDYTCILLDPMATGGICTIPCNGQTDMTTCSMANGFPGPGQGVCALAAKDAMGNIKTMCGIICGAQWGLGDTCPMGLTCQDKFNDMNMPGTNGKNDICIP